MRDHKPRILIVDDEGGFMILSKLALFSEYEICEETASARALEAARKFQPDLILLDVMMPGLDGGDVAGQLQNDPVLKHVPIVFLTAIVTERETAKHDLFGGYPFIAKPVNPEKLVETIERYLPVTPGPQIIS